MPQIIYIHNECGSNKCELMSMFICVMEMFVRENMSKISKLVVPRKNDYL